MTNMKSTKRALISSVMALFICFAMLLGTTYAWFTDEVSSKNNIIQSGTLEVMMKYADGTKDPASADWQDAETGTIFNYNNWEPGYVDAKHIQITNVGTLALNYKLRIIADSEVSKLAEVIDVYYFDEATALDRVNVEDGKLLGSLADIMGTEKNISNTVNGMLVPKAEETDTQKSVATLTLALKMQETAGNEYQNLSIGVDGFAVQLIATQATYEEDAFDDKYDALVPAPELPAALVMPIDPDEKFVSPADDNVVIVGENLLIDTTDSKMGADLGAFNLDAAYQFEPTMTEEQAKQSEYRYWHADFVVSADKDVPANSITLAGYYEAWCALNNDKWVALTANETIAAGTEIRLVANMADGFYVNWQELCHYGNDGVGFICGLAALDAEALAGTTVTVELRIYETTLPWNEENGSANIETGECKTVGTFTYTVPAYKVANQTELAEAIAAGITDIDLAAGNYTMPESNLRDKSLTIRGTKDAVIDVTAVDARDQFVTGATILFDGVTLNFGSKNYMGFANTASLTYKNCQINGLQFLYGDNVTFENCDLNSNGAEHCVWTYGAKNVTFTDCDFTYGDRGINCYKDQDIAGGKQTVNFTNCTFTTENTASEGAVEINSSAFSVGIEVNMEGCTAPAYGEMAYVSPWDRTEGAKTTINIK